MTTLVAVSTIPVAPADYAAETAPLTILPLAAPGQGTGRLIHPTLGPYDYRRAPDEWVNLDQDVVVPPIWASVQTLDGAANTLWAGHIRDVEVEERWRADGGLSSRIEHLRMLLAFWTTPPNPDTGFVEWWPNYTTTLGYKVVILAVTCGGEAITLDYVTRQGYVRGQIVLRMRIVDRA